MKHLFSLMFSYIWLNRAIFYLALAVGSLIAFSPAEAGLQPHFNDKVLHICGFFIMAFLAHMAHPKARVILLIAGLSTFGLAIEVVQAYLPYRSFSLWDWCADILGLLLYYQVVVTAFTRFAGNDRYVPD